MLDALPMELLVVVVQLIVLNRDKRKDLKTALRLDTVSNRVRAAMCEHIWPLYKLHVDIDVKSYLYWDDRQKVEIGRMRINKLPIEFDLPLLATLKDKGIGSSVVPVTGMNQWSHDQKWKMWKSPVQRITECQQLHDLSFFLPPVVSVSLSAFELIELIDKTVAQLLTEHKQTVKTVYMKISRWMTDEEELRCLHALSKFNELDHLGFFFCRFFNDQFCYCISHINSYGDIWPDTESKLKEAVGNSSAQSLTLYIDFLKHFVQQPAIHLPNVHTVKVSILYNEEQDLDINPATVASSFANLRERAFSDGSSSRELLVVHTEDHFPCCDRRPLRRRPQPLSRPHRADYRRPDEREVAEGQGRVGQDARPRADRAVAIWRSPRSALLGRDRGLCQRTSVGHLAAPAVTAI